MVDIKQTIYSISELNQSIKGTLERQFTTIWVTGEISNLTQPSSGHMYFNLKDKDATVRCVLFKFNQRQKNLALKNGLQIIAKANVSVYAPRGDYQLLISQIHPAGDGALHIKFEQLKKKLKTEGLFHPEHKNPLPQHPKTIGVITSATGGAIQDILHVLKRRNPFIKVIIYPTPVQGELAAPAISAAIQQANARHECDLLIVARGGGSLEDLWPFNEESVARAIFDSLLPIISGVGHETDTTISDLIADIRAATPSAAAEISCQDLGQAQQLIDTIKLRLSRAMLQKITQLKQQLQLSEQKLIHPSERLKQHAQTLDQLEDRYKQAMKHYLQDRFTTLQHLAKQLHTLSPLNTLARGYAIAKNEHGQIVTSASNAIVNSKITLSLHQGAVQCKVIKVIE